MNQMECLVLVAECSAGKNRTVFAINLEAGFERTCFFVTELTARLLEHHVWVQ